MLCKNPIHITAILAINNIEPHITIVGFFFAILRYDIFNSLNITLTVRLFWKFISKNWKFSFEEQRTSNAVSISLWTTAHLTDKRP
jgi:hypothetical protein